MRDIIKNQRIKKSLSDLGQTNETQWPEKKRFFQPAPIIKEVAWGALSIGNGNE